MLSMPVLMAFHAVGCGVKSGLDRKPVYGTIAGAEGREGTVTFRPVDSKSGPAATVDFADGTYRFTDEDGPIPGDYIVTVEFATRESVEAGFRLSYEPGKDVDVTVPIEGDFEINLDLK